MFINLLLAGIAQMCPFRLVKLYLQMLFPEVKSTNSKNIKSKQTRAKKSSQTKSGTGTGRFKKSAKVSDKTTKRARPKKKR